MGNIADPYEELKKWRKRFRNFFPEDFEREFGPVVMEDVHPGVRRKKGGLTVRVKLPGFSKKDIDVNVTESSIAISAESSEEKADLRKGSYRRAKKASAFRRVLALPEPVDPKSARAKYENGMLEVTLKTVSRKKGKSLRIK